MSSEGDNNLEKERYIEILKSNGITDKVKNIDIYHPDLAGDHFASTVDCITVFFEDEKLAPLDLFVKKVVKNGDYSVILKDMQMFEKEALFFNHILRDFEELCKEKLGSTDFLQNLLPKCYYADDTLVVLENLVKLGFSMKDKKKGHSFVQARKAMENFAKIHALSYCLVKDHGLERILKKYPTLGINHVWSEEGENLQGPWIQSVVECSRSILKENPTRGSEKVFEYINQLDNPQGSLFKKLSVDYKIENESCANVLNHGDMWNSNMMFKENKDTDEIEKCIFIDLQTIHIGSPVLDLQYYMNLTLTFSVRQEYWKKLLRIYYENLKTNVELFGHQLDFSFATFVNEYRRKCESGFMMSLYLVFGFDALEQLGDLDNIEGNIVEHISNTIRNHGSSFTGEKGVQFSKQIVTEYEGYLAMIGEKD